MNICKRMVLATVTQPQCKHSQTTRTRQILTLSDALLLVWDSKQWWRGILFGSAGSSARCSPFALPDVKSNNNTKLSTTVDYLPGI